MKRLALVVLVLSLLLPASAFARWELKVVDVKSRRERVFRPSAKKVFEVPIDLGGWHCGTAPDGRSKNLISKGITCLHKSGASVSSIAFRSKKRMRPAGFKWPARFTLRDKGLGSHRGWAIRLRWKW